MEYIAASHPASQQSGSAAWNATHVSVCICTYRRPELLRRLLEALERQSTSEAFTFSIVVADNDHLRSGHSTVERFATRSAVRVEYFVEPDRNIPLARNLAVQHARGKFVAWIDDDEVPTPDWLVTLFAAMVRHDVAGILGPVRPFFDAPPPRWLIDGRFCERAEHRTGTVMRWNQSFAGNCMIRLELLRQYGAPFRREFDVGGEDVDFFRRMTAQGHMFVWCNEAMVYEVVPRSRWTRTYRLKRAIMLGRSSLRLNDDKAPAKSLLAIPLYMLLPLTFAFGQHVFMKYCIKLSSHLGQCLAWCGLNPIKQRPD